MKAFHDDPEIKEKYLERLRMHKEADEIIQGVYWEEGKGCAVGCTIHGSDHFKYESELGIPITLAKLEDRIFEGLSNKDAKEWPLQFLESISVGVDLSLVWPKFAVWLLTDPEWGCVKYNKSSAITDISSLYKLIIDGKPPTIEEWRKARSASAAADAYADAAAASAASAAADASAAAAYDASAAAYAASAAACAYAYAVTSAADASAYAAYDAAYAASAADASAYAAAYAAAAAASSAYADASAYAYDAAAAAADASAKKLFYKIASEKLIDILRETKNG